MNKLSTSIRSPKDDFTQYYTGNNLDECAGSLVNLYEKENSKVLTPIQKMQLFGFAKAIMSKYTKFTEAEFINVINYILPIVFVGKKMVLEALTMHDIAVNVFGYFVERESGYCPLAKDYFVEIRVYKGERCINKRRVFYHELDAKVSLECAGYNSVKTKKEELTTQMEMLKEGMKMIRETARASEDLAVLDKKKEEYNKLREEYVGISNELGSLAIPKLSIWATYPSQMIHKRAEVWALRDSISEFRYICDKEEAQDIEKDKS